MATGILQPDGSRCYSGPTCKKHGAYNQSVMQAAKEFAADVERQHEEREKAKKEAAKTGTVIPSEYGPLGDWKDAVRWDYDGYAPPEGEDAMDYNRNYIYYGLYIEKIDPDELAEALFSPRTEAARQAAVDFIKENNLDSTDSYEIETSPGYYGQEVTLHMLEEKEATVKEWFYSFNNATDTYGVLDHVRAAGVDTAGLEPLEAVKEMLNKKVTDEWLLKAGKKANHMKVDNLTPAQIDYDDKLLEQAEKASLPDDAREEILGVVFKGKEGTLLLDGYDRLKTMTGRRIKRGQYVVLQNVAPGSTGW